MSMSWQFTKLNMKSLPLLAELYVIFCLLDGKGPFKMATQGWGQRMTFWFRKTTDPFVISKTTSNVLGCTKVFKHFKTTYDLQVKVQRIVPSNTDFTTMDGPMAYSILNDSWNEHIGCDLFWWIAVSHSRLSLIRRFFIDMSRKVYKTDYGNRLKNNQTIQSILYISKKSSGNRQK